MLLLDLGTYITIICANCGLNVDDVFCEWTFEIHSSFWIQVLDGEILAHDFPLFKPLRGFRALAIAKSHSETIFIMLAYSI